jgi:glycosyltransferase involved in cell wall biosynthesis
MTPALENTAPIRLLYVINGLGPGGAERSLAELLPFYLTANVVPTIVCLNRKTLGVESVVRELGCEIRFLAPGGLISRVRTLRRLIRQESTDLVHTTLFESDVTGRLAAIRTGVPVLTSLVNTSYDPVRLKDPNVRVNRLRMTQAVDGWTARHFTTHFHAITNAVKDSAVSTLAVPPDRITVIERGRTRERLGFPNPARRGIARRALGLAEDAEVIVNVARQEYQKGQKYLLEAAANLIRSRPRAVFLVCGREGHATEELKALHARLELGDRFRFLGDRNDVPEILTAADVFAFPSVYEGLGGAVIEAMALGLPVVASDIPALREIVEDGANGLLFPPESPTALARALAKILDDPSRASAFRARSQELFRERFTIESSAERMIQLYRRIVALSTMPGADDRESTPVLTGR